MAERLRIECITKSDRIKPDERILRVGGINSAGKRWGMSQSDAIAGIEAGTWDFYVTVGGRTVTVIVEFSRFGHKYLKTEADGERPGNLLSLPECVPPARDVGAGQPGERKENEMAGFEEGQGRSP